MVYGDQGVGKTSILNRLSNNEFNPEEPGTYCIKYFMSKYFITGKKRDKSI